MSDLDLIKEIEKLLGMRLERLENFEWHRKNYVLDSNDRVISLSLNAIGVKDKSEVIGVISELDDLKHLSLVYNQISDIGQISGLKKLQKLSLDSNPIGDLTPLTCFVSLNSVWLNNCRVKDLSPVSEMNNLKQIGFDENQISDLKPISGLKKLCNISLCKNQIINIKPLSDLQRAEYICLSNNHIEDLGGLSCLFNLETLALDGNKISELKSLSRLEALQNLFLDRNEIIDIRALSGLTSLKVLTMSYNKVNEIEPIRNFSDLTYLGLGGNALKKLPSWITDFPIEICWEYRKNAVVLFDNPLESPPPEIVKQGKEAVRNYFKQIEEQDKDYLFEAKLLIVGEPGAGKTTMARKLQDHGCELPKENETTCGIDVLKIDFPMHHEDFPQLDGVTLRGRQFRVNVWDFGGQEIYKATHRFFLNKRSLYILVADNRMEDTDFNYWLHVVEMFGGDSPLLIVQNEKQARKRELDIGAMKARFGNVRNDVLRVNFADQNPARLQVLDREIRQQIIKLPHVGSPVPSKWKVIRGVLEHDKRHTIALKDYLELCAEYGLKDKKDAMTLAQYFHDIGVFLHFQDDPLLRKTIFLDSDWATNAVYKILDDPLLDEEQGQFSIANAESIWCGEEHEFLRDELLRLMNKFYLAYEIDNSGQFIVPDKLPGRQPEYVWDKNENLRLTYDYDLFMPKGIMSQFIVEMHRFILDHNKVWKRGCLLERDGAVAEVVESYDARTIQIRIAGKNKRDFMTLIVDRLDSINAQYDKMQVDKMIPCNCTDCGESEAPYYYKYSDLKRRVDKGRHEVECGKCYEMVNVRQLIDDVLNENMLDEEKPFGLGRRKDKVFVSYSHKDKGFLERLQTHVKVLSHQGIGVDFWDDTTIKSGDRWEEKIKDALSSAGVAIMLVSTDFLASDFIMKNELPPLLQAAEKEGTTILPVIVSPCRFSKSPLSVFQTVNNNPSKPLSKLSASEQDEEFLKLVDRIEELIAGS